MWFHIACELALAACCTLNAVAVARHRAHLAVLGFGLIGLAALLGAAVYAGAQPMVRPHDIATVLASRLGLLLVAARTLRAVKWSAAVVALCAVAVLVPSPVDLAISLLALAAICWKGRSRNWALTNVGALLFALVGLVVGGKGEWLGVPRVDLYHLGLASAVLLWWRAGVGTRS